MTAICLHLGITIALGSLFVSEVFDPAIAQTPTPDPDAWRPFGFADLQKPTRRDATYIDIWIDAIEANNRVPRVHGGQRISNPNAPASEAHFVIWSARRAVVLSVLDTPLGCSEKARIASANVAIKLCPMRVAIYEGLRVRTLDAGRGCFIEPAPGVTLDPSAAAVYGAYDPVAHSLKIGAVVDRRALDGCSFNIPLGRD